MFAGAIAFTMTLAAVLLWPFQSAVKQTVTSTYPVAAHGTLSVTTPNGDIDVTACNCDAVKITVHKTAMTKAMLDALVVDVTTSNGDVKVVTSYPRGCTDCDLSYDIQAPRGVRVVSGTSSGDLSVREIQGAVDLNTSSGDIHVVNSGGQVDADTSSGSIRIEGASTRVRCKAASGEIKVTGARGDVDAQTASGDVYVRFDALAGVRAISLGTANGTVTLALPRNAGATINASTVSGSIESDFGVAPRKGYAGASLVQTMGDGRVRVELSTASGDIALQGT